MLWQQGKQDGKDTVGANGAFTDGPRESVHSDFGADHEFTFLGEK